jgi:hypothetical protein
LLEMRHSGTWSAAARPPCRLCYRPAVFFCHMLHISLSFSQWKMKLAFQKCKIFDFFSFVIIRVWNCLNLNSVIRRLFVFRFFNNNNNNIY